MLSKTVVFVVLILTLTCWALQLPDALNLYLELVREYETGSIQNPFLIKTVESLEHFALYRYYRFLIAGSVDKREATPDLGYYLSLIYSSYDFETEEEQLAAALFLSYLSSKLAKTRLTADYVMKDASFIDFFTRYRDVISREARSFFAWIIAYQVGLTDEKPPLDLVQRYRIEITDYSFTPPIDLKHLVDLTTFYSDPTIQSILTQALERVVENAKKDPARIAAHINREAAFVARDIVKPITNFQTYVAQTVQKITPAEKNYWWLRLIVYTCALFAAIRFVKLRSLLLGSVLGFEAIYLFFFFDPTSMYESLTYGLVLIFGFAFAALRLPKKRPIWLNVVCIILIVLAAIFPLVPRCEELSMDKREEFLGSRYYDLLKRELYVDELSLVSQYVRRLSSTMYTSMEDTKAIVNDLVETLANLNSRGVVTEILLSSNYGAFFNDLSSFFRYGGSKGRMEMFQPLSNTLRFYLLDERSRMKSFERDLDSLLKYSKRLVEYSAPRLRQEFKQHIEGLFSTKYPILSDLQSTFEKRIFQNSQRTASPHIRIFNNRSSLSIILITILVFLTNFFLNPKISVGPSIVLLIVSVMGWLNVRNLMLIVEQTSPLLQLQTSSSINPLVFLVAMFVASVNLLKLFRKGESR
ncbi:hypothetical protein AJ81_01860 [Pseudothermotoga hypogea DSM 11164 = NBRC 106472]|uniref:Uncharacterized protein n=1 Tax=Pseudothermotoga hypogea DSM 11164 = NBRC 106472 TaxID=1123384 RepID=A0A0X1KTN7_9THEM|nr:MULTISPECIES: hypothetical protein [Pseudothermotoga]AJC74639.1 hypothetical protein AJ81_01860 [Pseudothermotoga hypogea DSM 11164 = NBRC 106472]MDI6861852.1 hypothetical protein [Pseudothermotoga sp.]